MTNATFQGRYVEDVKLALVASAVSGVHCILLGAPGRGKTKISKKMAKKMFGKDRRVFLRFDATTPPEKIQGTPDIGKLLSEQSVYEIIKDGSIYDDNARVIVLDELFRAMDTSYDIVLDALDRQDIDSADAPVAFITSNFSATSERTEALRDRIGLWVWLPNEPIDYKAAVRAQMESYGVGLDVTDHIPTYEDICRIRSSKPGPNAIEAVANVCDSLAREAEKGVVDDKGHQIAGFDVNYRRLDQWNRILYGMTVWLTGMTDFTEADIPNEAKKCLQWAWPLTDQTMASCWAALCTSIADPIEGAIDALKQNAYKKFKELSDKYNLLDKSNPQTVKRGVASVEFGKVLSENQTALFSLQGAEDDPRVSEAINEMAMVMSRYVRGEDPFAT